MALTDKPEKTRATVFFQILTALLHGVASFQVITGPGRMFPAAIGTFHAADLTAEGLQGIQDPRVHRQDGSGVAVGQSFILAELGRRRRAGIVVLGASKQIIDGSSGTSWGTRRTCRTRLSRRSLRKKKIGIAFFLKVLKQCV